jgi:hypothetical protein
VERCLRPVDKERVRYRASVIQVWEYLDRTHMRQDVFLHDLMKLIYALKEIGEKNYRGLEEYLDLLIQTFHIAKEGRMLPIVLHMNNLRPMYEKWSQCEQARWRSHAERFDLKQQPKRFRRFILTRYHVVAMLASHVAISSTTSRGGCQKDGGQKPKDGQNKQGGGGQPPQRASVNVVAQQPAVGCPQPATTNALRTGASVCKEAHPLEKFEHFKKLSPEQQVVKASELHLCLVCLRHTADRECYTKGKPDYRGCSQRGCGVEHHPLLHWALIEARLFQVQVASECYPPGTQIFQLRQQIKIGKMEVCLSFDGGSNHSVITKEYAAKKKLKKVSFTVPVIGFGRPEAEMGELYEVPLKASGKRNITIRAEAVEFIHSGPPAKCPDNTTRPGGQPPGTCTSQEEPQMPASGWTIPSCSLDTWRRSLGAAPCTCTPRCSGTASSCVGWSCPRWWSLWT